MPFISIERTAVQACCFGETIRLVVRHVSEISAYESHNCFFQRARDDIGNQVSSLKSWKKHPISQTKYKMFSMQYPLIVD